MNSRSVVDPIVPAAIRGTQKEPFGNGTWSGGGGVLWANFVYERVTISYIADGRINTGLGLGESVDLDLSDDAVSKQAEKPKTLKEDFSLYSGSTVEIVTVHWSDRKCANR